MKLDQKNKIYLHIAKKLSYSGKRNMTKKIKYIFISLKNYHIVVREIFVTVFSGKSNSRQQALWLYTFGTVSRCLKIPWPTVKIKKDMSFMTH